VVVALLVLAEGVALAEVVVGVVSDTGIGDEVAVVDGDNGKVGGAPLPDAPPGVFLCVPNIGMVVVMVGALGRVTAPLVTVVVVTVVVVGDTTPPPIFLIVADDEGLVLPTLPTRPSPLVTSPRAGRLYIFVEVFPPPK
jgi:hypothetical protein